MIPALALRGFGHGSGVLDPSGKIFIVNIPKNASSYVLSWAQHHGWRAGLIEHAQQVQEVIVLLRDPIQRWISGMAQYINTYILSVQGPNGPVLPHEPITVHDYVMSSSAFAEQYTDLVERVIFDNAARFDDHVWPQNEIIQDILPTAPHKYFLVDQDLDRNLATYLGWRAAPDLDRNAGGSNPNIKYLQEFFRQRLFQRPELIDRLRRHYHADYELISRVLP
jgi:hypothetical protein